MVGVYSLIYLTVTAWTLLSEASEVHFSDACHGNIYNQTINILNCSPRLQVCIISVTYYQWQQNVTCPREIPTGVHVDPTCCKRNPNRCSWRNNTEQNTLQKLCGSNSTCKIQSLSPGPISFGCHDRTVSGYSSVRSIAYTCSYKGNCSSTTTTTVSPKRNTLSKPGRPSIAVGSTANNNEDKINSTRSVVTQETTQNNKFRDGGLLKQNDRYVTYTIVGAVVGGVVLCVIAVVVVVYVKRRSRKLPRPTVDPYATSVIAAPQSSSSENGSIDYNPYSVCGPDLTASNTPVVRSGETRISDLYSKVNKIKHVKDNCDVPEIPAQATPGHGEYDRIQGEAAQFPHYGDYDHVVGYAEPDENYDIRTRDDVDMTYDQLHRGQAISRTIEPVTNPYNVLNRANVRT